MQRLRYLESERLLISFKTFFLVFLSSTLLFADVGVLKKVVDGDTLYFRSGGRTVKCRIAYIDTPESHRNARAKRKAKTCMGVTLDRMIEAGREASRHAKTLISIGKSYRFDIKGRDRYGRSICIVRLPGGETYNEKMVKDGYAVPFWKYISSSMRQRYKIASKEAKSDGMGLWRRYLHVMKCLIRK